jgi:hypothetical protein
LFINLKAIIRILRRLGVLYIDLNIKMFSTVVGILPKEPNTEEGEASLENRIGAAAVVVQVSPNSSLQ